MLSASKTLREYVEMSFGIALYVFAWTAFLIPREIVGGGATGLSSLVFYATGIPVSYVFFAINVVLIVIGTIILGKGFGVKTIYCILLTTVLLKVFPMIPWVTNIDDNLLNCIIGGALSAVGLSIVFKNGGSSGGTDIIALIISKFTEKTTGKAFMYCDLVIITSVLFLPGKTLEDVIYGYVVMITFSLSIDYFTMGAKQSVQIMVFSDRYAEIADMLTNQMDRGVTAFNSIGWYTRKDGKVLVVIARKTQTSMITKAIKEIDPHVFITVCQVSGVFGCGFEEIKSGVNGIWKSKKQQKNS